MIPAKIEDVFIQLTTDNTGVITCKNAGKFLQPLFNLEESIFIVCPFLEGTLEALPLKESFTIEGMLIVKETEEFNVDVELFKENENTTVLIHNRTNVYKFVEQLNQNRNDLFFLKREIIEKNKELERLRKVADNANKEKSRFLAMMSHEIRNPLNAILGYSEMIAEENISESVKKYNYYLRFAGKNLKVIVDDILDLSRIEAGKLELVSEKIDIREIVNICLQNFKHQLNKNIELVLKLDEKLPRYILGDAVRINQILSNLVSNAIKFTEKGFVKISVSLASCNKKKATLKFMITDSGRGMTTEQISKIFDEYQQNTIDDNRLKGGAGLGLAIVKRLVVAMNGTISVESKLTKGTSFVVEIPFRIDTNKFEEKENKPNIQTKKSLKNKKILLADDDDLNQTIAAHILTKEDASITLVKDGLDALQYIEKEVFDVILLDINMPNLTGEELMLQKEKISLYNTTTPFLALTANTTSEDIARYKSLGFKDVISKPYTTQDFLKIIQNNL